MSVPRKFAPKPTEDRWAAFGAIYPTPGTQPPGHNPRDIILGTKPPETLLRGGSEIAKLLGGNRLRNPEENGWLRSGGVSRIAKVGLQEQGTELNWDV